MVELVDASYAARWQVVEQLYSLLERLPEGSPDANIVEHAISLALNPQRIIQDIPWLLHDVLRNARFSVRRAEKRREALYQKVENVTIRDQRTIDYATPETIFVNQECVELLYKSIALLSPHALRCLEGMIAQESIEETASACELSRRSVDRIRRQIRIVARTLLGEN